jgi:hypothetical protein
MAGRKSIEPEDVIYPAFALMIVMFIAMTGTVLVLGFSSVISVCALVGFLASLIVAILTLVSF